MGGGKREGMCYGWGCDEEQGRRLAIWGKKRDGGVVNIENTKLVVYNEHDHRSHIFNRYRLVDFGIKK